MATFRKTIHAKTNSKGITFCRVAVKITAFRKHAYIFTGHTIKKEDWDEQAKQVKTKHPDSRKINRVLLKKYNLVDDVIHEDTTKDLKQSAALLKDKVAGIVNGTGLIDLGEEYIKMLNQLGKLTQADTHTGKLNRIKNFKGKNIKFSEINEAWLNHFKVWLMRERVTKTGITIKGVNLQTVANYFIFIRLLYNRAITKGLVSSNLYPFGKGKVLIKIPKTKKIGLTENEFKRFQKLEFEKGSLKRHTQNIWLFSFYFAGMRISDTLKIKWSNIIDNRLYYAMAKNSKLDSLPIHPKVIEILKDYQADKNSNNDYIFPELKKAKKGDIKDLFELEKAAICKFNRQLKGLAKLAKIEKKLTNHIARHTFGSIAGDKISPQALQKLYRHSNISTTMNYQANFHHKNTDKALLSVVNF